MRESSKAIVVVASGERPRRVDATFFARALSDLAQAIEAEVAEWIECASAPAGPQRPSPGGAQRPLAEANDVTGVGPVEVQQPRVLDRRARSKRNLFPRRFCRLTCGRRRAWRN